MAPFWLVIWGPSTPRISRPGRTVGSNRARTSRPAALPASGHAMARSRQAGYAPAVNQPESQIGPRCSCRRRVPVQGARAVGC